MRSVGPAPLFLFRKNKCSLNSCKLSIFKDIDYSLVFFLSFYIIIVKRNISNRVHYPTIKCGTKGEFDAVLCNFTIF